MHERKGFSIAELLIYLTILIVVASLFVGILNIVGRTQVRQSAEQEATSQLNVAMQTIQRLVRESNLVITPLNCSGGSAFTGESPAGTPKNCIVLRMPDAARDPTCIVRVAGGVKNIAVLPPLVSGQTCDGNNPTYLLTNRAYIPNEAPQPFTRYKNYPGHDQIQVSLTVNYNDQGNPALAFSKSLSSAVSRASAATFDDGILRGGGVGDVGNFLAPWDKVISTWLYANAITNLNNPYSPTATTTLYGNLEVTDRGNLVVQGHLSEAGNYADANRGAKVIGARGSASESCTNVCAAHGFPTCVTAVNLNAAAFPLTVTCDVTANNRLCLCDNP